MNAATTVRFAAEIRDALERLSKLAGCPKNKLINDAVAAYIKRQATAIADEASMTLEQVKAYRTSDPDFEAAISDFAEAEASLGHGDELEGRPFEDPSSLTEKVRRVVHA